MTSRQRRENEDSDSEESTDTEEQERTYLQMEKDTTASKNNNEYKSPVSLAAKVRRIIADGQKQSSSSEGSKVVLNPHTLFTQLDVLVHFDDGKKGWKEMARWLKYEETVEVGDRWSKPHVPTAQMHALLELRKAFADGVCATGLGVSAHAQIADAVVETLKKEKQLSESLCQKIRSTLLHPHKHKHRCRAGGSSKHASDAENGRVPSHANDPASRGEYGESEKKKPFLRRRSGDGKDIAAVYHNYPQGIKPDNLAPYKPNKHLSKKLPGGCESANILVGQVDFLKEPVMAFVRLSDLSVMGDLTEVDVPLRFLLLILGPPPNETNIWEMQEMGRAMAALLNDKVFCEVAYQAKTTQDILAGIDEFMDDVTVLPPSIWDPATRLEPPKQTRSMDKIMFRLDEEKRKGVGPIPPPQEEGASDDHSLKRTGRIFGGLIQDIKSRYRHYLSDIKDGLHIQCVASTIFLFFACITPIVTFGGLMGQKTDGYMGTMETLMSGAVCGVLYAAFAGQPLTIVGATGPLLIFESILYYLCKENGLDFMAMRFWIGFWVMVALLVIVAFDLSALVQYITRFTEESFAILISVIFIYEAFTKIYEIYHHSPVHQGVVRETPGFNCFCVPFAEDDDGQYLNDTTPEYSWGNMTDNGTDDTSIDWVTHFPEHCLTYTSRIEVNSRCISEDECLHHGWNLTGPACGVPRVTESVPDVFFLSLILFIGTFSLAYFFRLFRTMRYFPSRVRSTVADFAVFLSVLTFTLIDFGFGIETPKLNVPEEFVTTRRDRGWLVNPGNVGVWWLIPLSIVPALLATILVFLDQQITSVIVNRKEHKLKKAHGYHLDLFVLAFLILICSLLGLPWFVAATVRAITHVRSLMKESEVSIPGERPQVIGVREQRVTGICIHLLIGFSTLLTSILRLIPMPVLYGVFLYMGITSLAGVQFIERISVMLMPVKYQPDLVYLRHVKTKRVHLFTVVQLICFIGMWVVKQIKMTSIAFPLMLIALMAARKCLDFIFTQGELYWLDHLLPEEHRRQKEDADKALEEGEARSRLEMKSIQNTRVQQFIEPLVSKADEAKADREQGNITHRM